jgi:hypothetical protein
MRFWEIRDFRAKCLSEIFKFSRRKLMSLAGWGESDYVAGDKVTLDPISEFVAFSVALSCCHASMHGTKSKRGEHQIVGPLTETFARIIFQATNLRNLAPK